MKNADMERLVQEVTRQVMATMASKEAPQKAAPKPKKSQTAASFTTKKSGDFTALFKNGRKLGHFNHGKGLFWFYRNQIGSSDWKEISKFIKKFAKKADFERNADRFKRAGILSSADFGKVSFETFLLPAKKGGIFC